MIFYRQLLIKEVGQGEEITFQDKMDMQDDAQVL